MTLEQYVQIAGAAVALVQALAVLACLLWPGTRAAVVLGALARVLPADMRPVFARLFPELPGAPSSLSPPPPGGDA